MLEYIDCYPGNVAEQSEQADVLEIPDDIDVLEAHSHDTCGGADDDDASAGTCAVCKHMPERSVHEEVGEICRVCGCS